MYISSHLRMADVKIALSLIPPNSWRINSLFGLLVLSQNTNCTGCCPTSWGKRNVSLTRAARELGHLVCYRLKLSLEFSNSVSLACVPISTSLVTRTFLVLALPVQNFFVCGKWGETNFGAWFLDSKMRVSISYTFEIVVCICWFVSSSLKQTHVSCLYLNIKHRPKKSTTCLRRNLKEFCLSMFVNI